MKRGLIVSVVVFVLIVGVFLFFQFRESGDSVVFIEWNQEMGEDCITENVCLTKADRDGLYNSVLEDSHNRSISPMDTEWARGRCSEDSSFDVMFATTGKYGESLLSQGDWCLHLITDDLYFDFKFLAWVKGAHSYERASYEKD